MILPPLKAPFDRDAWLDAREHGIGCSELGTVLGLESDRDVLNLWLRKRAALRGEKQERRPDNPAQKRGRLLEDTVLRFAEEDLGVKLAIQGRDYDVPITSPDYLGGSPDALIVEAARIIVEGVEAKTAAGRVALQYGEPGTDEIPEHHLLQCHGYMAVTGARRWHLCVLVGGAAFEFRRYVVERDETLCRVLRAKVRAWWERHVIAGEDPPVRGVAAGELARHKWPVHRDGLLVVENGAALETVLRMRSAQSLLGDAQIALDAMNDDFDNAEGEVKALIGQAEGISGPWGEVTWRSTKRGRTLRAKFYGGDET